MDRKAQVGFGFIITAAVVILIGLALYSGTFAQNIGTMTKTTSVTNATMTMPAASATADMTPCGQRAITYVLNNASWGNETIPTTNYTVTQGTGSDGYRAARITTTANSVYASQSVKVTCTYEPKGYIAESSSRGIVGLIAIFMAILILVAALPPVKDKLFDFIRS